MKLSAFDAALLSQASYAYLDYLTKPELNLTLVDVLKDTNEDLYQGTFSQSQAEEFVARWEVAYHEENTPSGFSGTLFKSKAPYSEKLNTTTFLH